MKSAQLNFLNLARVALFILMCGLSLSSKANEDFDPEDSPPLPCSTLVTDLKVKTGTESWMRMYDRFYYQDDEYGFLFMADLKSDGTFSLEMKLSDKEAGIRSRYRASDLYQRAFEHFGPLNIKRVESYWSSGVNYEFFHDPDNQDIPPKRRILSSWSGKTLRDLGFTEVAFFELLHNSESKKQDRIHIFFERSNPENFSIKQGEETYIKDESTFSYRDETYNFEFYALLFGDGQLFLSTHLVDAEQKIRSHKTGKKLFSEMIKHFGVENIKVIEDTYGRGSVNRDQYFTNRAIGLSQETSAQLTWSGQRAMEHGFSVVSNVSETWQDELPPTVEPRRKGGAHIVSVEYRKP